jgi:hypothetical protein
LWPFQLAKRHGQKQVHIDWKDDKKIYEGNVLEESCFCKIVLKKLCDLRTEIIKPEYDVIVQIDIWLDYGVEKKRE